jgi:hypothetical protein
MGRMKTLGTLVVATAFLGFGLVGCAADSREDVGTGEDGLVGWLVSPPNFGEEDLVGAWVPVDPAGFVGEAKGFQFSADRSYHSGAACSGQRCAKSGDWNLTNHPIPTSVVGTYVNTQPKNTDAKSYFVWRTLSGEIRLVDINTCVPFLLFSCKNTWTKTPTLNQSDL